MKEWEVGEVNGNEKVRRIRGRGLGEIRENKVR